MNNSRMQADAPRGGGTPEAADDLDMRREVQLACFALGAEHYAINIMKIREIIRLLPVTPLPSAPDFIEGVINLRGAIIPVMDMRARFNLERRPGGDTERMIVVSVEGRLVALVVDAVTDVIRAPMGDIQPPPRVLADVGSEFMLGVCRRDDMIIIILDIDKLLTTDEKIRLETIEGTRDRDDRTAASHGAGPQGGAGA